MHHTPPLHTNTLPLQACTEMVMPMCNDGVNDMFYPSPWNLTDYTADCLRKYNVPSRPLMAPLMYGGINLTGSSNIVFANGLLDPWSSGGVMRSLSDTLVSVIIPNVRAEGDTDIGAQGGGGTAGSRRPLRLG